MSSTADKWFTLTMNEVTSRRMTRAEYKAANRYLRTAARIMRERAPELEAAANKAAENMVAFGSGIIFFSAEKTRVIENIYDTATQTYKPREL